MKIPEGRLTDIYAMNGLGTIRVATTIGAGRGTRNVPIDLSPELIVRLGRLLEVTKGTACETDGSRFVDHDEHGYHVGHALWHLKNPERAVPCIDQSRVIDMRSLTSGDESE
jgi:hypothetical protein